MWVRQSACLCSSCRFRANAAYPVQMLPDFIAKVSPLLPLTHAVTMMRAGHRRHLRHGLLAGRRNAAGIRAAATVAWAVAQEATGAVQPVVCSPSREH